jgi:hypothetical protein
MQNWLYEYTPGTFSKEEKASVTVGNLIIKLNEFSILP